MYSQYNNKRQQKFPQIPRTDCCFSVQVVKNERGLGISVYGGIDANVPYRGLIRIKRLFPNQSAWSTGMLQPGDILLEANEIPLTGLTNHVSFSCFHRFFFRTIPCHWLCAFSLTVNSGNLTENWIRSLISLSLSLSSKQISWNRKRLKFCVQHQMLLI